MGDKGEAVIAVGAAITACILGAVFEALVLALLLPVLREIFLVFELPEMFSMALPGLGSAAAGFIAYGHARQSSQAPDSFGTGHVDGVIAPKAANDAVEGGTLASTVAFGMPGLSSMAMRLSAFSIPGLQTGPAMLMTGCFLTSASPSCFA